MGQDNSSIAQHKADIKFSIGGRTRSDRALADGDELKCNNFRAKFQNCKIKGDDKALENANEIFKAIANTIEFCKTKKFMDYSMIIWVEEFANMEEYNPDRKLTEVNHHIDLSRFPQECPFLDCTV